MFWPLQVGAQIILAPPGDHRDVRRLVDLVRREGVTHIDFIPAMLDRFLAEPSIADIKSLKLVTTGGESVPYALTRNFYAQFPDTLLLSLYGPTEAAIDVCHQTGQVECAGNDFSVTGDGYLAAAAQMI